MFELRQLKFFVTVARELSFSKAAVLLNITQPPLSRQIQLLEEDINVRLFDRSSKAIKLTYAGKEFLKHAEHLLREAESAALSTKLVNQGKEGTVSLGFFPASSYFLIPYIVSQVKNEFPNIHLDLREIRTHEQENALLSEKLDIGIMRPCNNYFLERRVILTEKFILALPDSFVGDVNNEQKLLESLPLIMFSPDGGYYCYSLLMRLFSDFKIKQQIIQQTSQTPSIIALVNGGVGAALVPETAKILGFSNVRFVDLAIVKNYAIHTELSFNPNNQNVLVKKVVDLIMDGVNMKI